MSKLTPKNGYLVIDQSGGGKVNGFAVPVTYKNRGRVLFSEDSNMVNKEVIYDEHKIIDLDNKKYVVCKTEDIIAVIE